MAPDSATSEVDRLAALRQRFSDGIKAQVLVVGIFLRPELLRGDGQQSIARIGYLFSAILFLAIAVVWVGLPANSDEEWFDYSNVGSSAREAFEQGPFRSIAATLIIGGFCLRAGPWLSAKLSDRRSASRTDRTTSGKLPDVAVIGVTEDKVHVLPWHPGWHMTGWSLGSDDLSQAVSWNRLAVRSIELDKMLGEISITGPGNEDPYRVRIASQWDPGGAREVIGLLTSDARA